MTTEPQMHHEDLGSHLDEDSLARVLAEHRGNPAVQAILQHLRNQAFFMDKIGRQPPASAPEGRALDFRAYHAGAADILEEVFWFLREKTALTE